MLAVISLVSLASNAASSRVGDQFQSRWRSDRGEAIADAALGEGNDELPAHCSLAVVGAGWGGSYLAWRMTIDTGTVNASDICVFEANGRVGGRIYSVRDLPRMGDLALDVGGYRFQESQKLPADLVWTQLKLPTTCYDYSCKGQCEGPQNCYVIRDAYGNNAGYASPIERMLGEIEDKGDGRQVYFGATLTGVDAAPAVSPSAVSLKFSSGARVTADRAVLNLPGNAISNLNQSSILFGGGSRVAEELDSVGTFAMNKVYAYYEDAWWATKLGLMEGYFPPASSIFSTSHIPPQDFSNRTSRLDVRPLKFDSGGHKHLEQQISIKTSAQAKHPPLEGRYHDGPLRCVIGHDTAGLPIYSGKKVPYGTCSGALEVFYGRAMPYYRQQMSSPNQPLTVVSATDGDNGSKALLTDVHDRLMSYHKEALQAKGFDPASLPPPTTVVVANWIANGAFTPGIGRLLPGTDKERKDVRMPDSKFKLHVVDQDYGYETGWAVGSLAMAEKVLQAAVGLERPSWLDATWYQKWVADKP